MRGAKNSGKCECGHAAAKHDKQGYCTVPDCDDCEGYCCQDCESSRLHLFPDWRTTKVTEANPAGLGLPARARLRSRLVPGSRAA